MEFSGHGMNALCLCGWGSRDVVEVVQACSTPLVSPHPSACSPSSQWPLLPTISVSLRANAYSCACRPINTIDGRLGFVVQK